MTLRLTPETLEAGYDFLLTTAPFKRWKLPPSDDVEFHVIRTKAIFADCVMDGETPVIRVSEGKNGHPLTLLTTLAHEMIHVRQFMEGDSGNHNSYFHKLAKQVCTIHGFDLKAF